MNAPVQGRSRLGILLSLMIAAVVCMAFAGAASAAIGDITGMSCISKTGANGCAALPEPNVLSFSASVAVAPDGTDVYVGAGAGVAHFRRSPTGELTYASCSDTTSSIGDSCPTSAPADGGNSLSLNSISVAISPNGKALYAVSPYAALVWWNRDLTTGALTWGGCRDGDANAASNGHCGTATTFGGGNFPAGSMDFPQGIAVTPDGDSLFIADQTEGLLQAQINPTTGVPTPTSCFNTTGSAASGCAALASGIPMAGVGIGVASNSRDVYLNSVSPGGITHFQRSAGGSTSFESCIVPSSATVTCLTSAPSPTFTNPGAIGVSGTNVFQHGGNYGTPDGTVSKFVRDAEGALTFVNCATTVAAAGGCAPMPTGTLSGNIGKLLISPDGSSVYTRQTGSPGAITRFTGDLAFAGCIGVGVAVCGAPSLPAPFAVATGGSAFSPDGRQIYQAASDQLNIFNVETSPPGASPTPIAQKPKIRSIKKMRTGRHRGKYRVKISVAQPGVIAARFEGRLKRGAKLRSLSKLAKRSASRAGTYAFYIKPSKAALKRKLKASLVATLAPPGYVAAKATKSIRLR